MRRMVAFPDGSSGFGRVRSSMYGRWRSGSPASLSGSRPKSASISASEPYASVRGYAGSSLTHTGMGVPK